MREEFILDYVVIKNDGVNAHQAEAGFMSESEAVAYAEKRAGEYQPFNASDSDSVYNSARVARYEVVLVHGDERDDEWDSVYETNSFYND